MAMASPTISLKSNYSIQNSSFVLQNSRRKCGELRHAFSDGVRKEIPMRLTLKSEILNSNSSLKFFARISASLRFSQTKPNPNISQSARALFTGIVEEMGTVKELKEVDGGWELTVSASTVLEDVKLGDSIAVNGTCLTVTRFDESTFAVGLAPETLRKTSLGELKGAGDDVAQDAKSLVNLERSLSPSSRMGGHFVQGHVDGTGVIRRFWEEGDSLWVNIHTTPELLRYIVPKGYIAVDGTSLTVVDVSDEDNSFTFMLVAYTQQKIVVPLKSIGDKVNLEVDIVGKYVERMMQGYQKD